MDVGGAQIVVVVMVVMIVIVVIVIMAMRVAMMMVVMVVAQQPGAGEVDDEAEHRDARSPRCRRSAPDAAAGRCFPMRSGSRSCARMIALENAARSPNLPVPKREARIARLPPRQQVGQPRNPERGRMGCHMPAVGQQRHRSGQPSGDDLADHHHGRQARPRSRCGARSSYAHRRGRRDHGSTGRSNASAWQFSEKSEIYISSTRLALCYTISAGASQQVSALADLDLQRRVVDA